MINPIHQLVHTLSYGDAISTEVLALQRCFRAMGAASEIYAINVHPRYKGQALDYRELSLSFSGQIVLHYSLGSPLNALYRKLSAARRVLIYHNLTPAHWFRGVNPRIQRDIEEGLRELPELCGITDSVLADSRFNAGEIEALGFLAKVLELPIDPEKWNIARNEGIYQIVKGEGGVHLLHVGRLAPNKCVEDIIKTFYFYHHSINPQSRLWLVGIDIDTELYSYSLKRLVHELRLDGRVNFPGCLADSEVRALYEACSVYLCMSEHEGFCLPVIEAMHFGLPVISYAASALPDTVGKGGVLVSEKRHAELAELVDHLVQNEALRAELKEAGKERVGELSFANFEAHVRALFSVDTRAAERSRVATPHV